jgi:phage gp36-like protein
MTFLTQEDFKAVCDDNTLSVINQADLSNLDRAESYAKEEIASYLRARYDIDKAFGEVGDKRNSQLVMIACDIALYHLIAWLPKRIGFEIREIRYKRAIEWLQEVQASKASPSLPLITDSTTGSEISQFKFGSWKRHNYEY